jgi:hypothetical protein
VPGWPRLILFGLGMAIPYVVSGIDGEGTDDFIGGILILAAVFWPGPEFIVQFDNTQLEVSHRKIGWPSLETVVDEIRSFGQDPTHWDGVVMRYWRTPFPLWSAGRDYLQ